MKQIGQGEEADVLLAHDVSVSHGEQRVDLPFKVAATNAREAVRVALDTYGRDLRTGAYGIHPQKGLSGTIEVRWGDDTAKIYFEI